MDDSADRNDDLHVPPVADMNDDVQVPPVADRNDDVYVLPVEDEMGAAVDDALADELKRQKARFIQAMLEVDRGEGVGRRDRYWDDGPYRALGLDQPDEPRD